MNMNENITQCSRMNLKITYYFKGSLLMKW